MPIPINLAKARTWLVSSLAIWIALLLWYFSSSFVRTGGRERLPASDTRSYVFFLNESSSHYDWPQWMKTGLDMATGLAWSIAIVAICTFIAAVAQPLVTQVRPSWSNGERRNDRP